MKNLLLLTAGVLAALVAGCSSQSGESAPATTENAQAPSEAAVSVLDAYETIRSDLASDQEPEPSDYARLASAARGAMAEYEGGARESLSELASAADAAAESASGLSAARIQFGKVSEPLIGFLSSRPELVEGRFVFSCPMTKGYPKWVQRSETVSNPYMGTEMASCGTVTDWAR